MQCSNCRYPLEDSDVLCPVCGSVVKPDIPSDVAKPAVAVKDKPEVKSEPTVKEPAPKPRKKSKRPLIIALIAVGVLLIAAAVGAVGYFCGWWGNKPDVSVGTHADLYNAAAKLASSQSITLTVDTRTSYNGIVETDQLVIKLDRPKTMLSTERTLSHDGIVTVEKTAVNADSTCMYFKEGTALARGSIVTADQTAMWDSIGNAMAGISGKKGLYDVLTSIKTGTLQRYIDAGYINTDGLKTDLAALQAHFKDEAWLKTHLGFAPSRDGDDFLFTFRFDMAKLMPLITAELSHSFTDDNTYGLVKNAASSWSTMLGGKPCEIVVRVKNGTIATVTVKATVDKASVTATVTPSAVNQTAVDFSGIKATVLTANQGHELCLLCGEAPAYILGKCDDCYKDTMCQSDCGNEAADGFDAHCAACFVKCAACDSHGDNEAPDGTFYCDTCYQARYCRNGDGNAVHKDGYCQSCFVPCGGCAQHHATFVGEQPLCNTCYYTRFCINGDGNTVFKDGHCEACYTPCVQCGDKAGNPYYDSRCEQCYAASSSDVTTVTCAACGAMLYDETFEKDGYTLCFHCYTGAVSMCHYCQSNVAYFQNGQSRLCHDCYKRHVLNKPCARCGNTGLLLSYGGESLCTACYPDV